MAGKMKEMHIFGIGNPLLDITCTVNEEFLEKYHLPKHSAILAEAEHQPMYEEIINKFEIEYSAGGATQNTMRYCQWVVGKNNSVATFIGAVGNDYFGRIMEKKARNDGVNAKYQVIDDAKTGTCAVLLTDNGKCRSLCAYLGASEKLDKHYLLSNFMFAEKAQLIYTSGHMLPAAPYVSHKCSRELVELLPYVDFFFSNAEEAAALATMKGYHTKEPKEVAKLISKEPKVKYTNPKIPSAYKSGRIVIITQSDKPVIFARSDSNEIKEYPVPQLKEEQIKDTNGAGDAFTGGFLAMYITGKTLDVCIKCAIYCAFECIQQQGCTLPKKMNFKP